MFKRVLLIAVVALFLSGPVCFAQESQDPKDQLARMTEEYKFINQKMIELRFYYGLLKEKSDALKYQMNALQAEMTKAEGTEK